MNRKELEEARREYESAYPLGCRSEYDTSIWADAWGDMLLEHALATTWITDRPPTVEEVGDDDQCLATVSTKEIEATMIVFGNCARGDWQDNRSPWRTIAWMPMPKPYEGE